MPDTLTNLIPCDDWETPFVDAYSQFSLGFDQKNMGPSWLHPRAAIVTYEIAMPLLHLWLREGDGWQIIRRQALTSLPWKQSEEASFYASGEPVRIQTDYVFVDARQLQARWRFTNEGSKPVSLELAWAGCLRDRNQPTHAMNPYLGAKHGQRELVCSCIPDGIEAGLQPDPATSDLPQVRYRIRTPGSQLIPSLMEGPIWGGVQDNDRARYYRFANDQPIAIEPGESFEVMFIVDFRGAAVTQPLDPWEMAESVDFEELLKRAESRYKQRVKIDDFGEAPSLDRLHLLRARTSILRTGVRGHNGEFGEHIATVCSSGTQDFSCSFFWDTFFTSTALSRFNPEFARGALATAFTRQHPRDGSTPERKWNYSCPKFSSVGCPQSAIGAWALKHYLRHNNGPEDIDFARGFYPRLKANHIFWRDFSDADNDGLSEYNWTGQIGDDSQLWDAVASARDPRTGCAWLPPIAFLFSIVEGYIIVKWPLTAGVMEDIRQKREARRGKVDMQSGGIARAAKEQDPSEA
jgi:hypothetical protein